MESHITPDIVVSILWDCFHIHHLHLLFALPFVHCDFVLVVVVLELVVVKAENPKKIRRNTDQSYNTKAES